MAGVFVLGFALILTALKAAIMSNKTILQTNNTNLASYTDRVAALINVANSLPDAGSGGSSGGGIETCTLSLTSNSPWSMPIEVYCVTTEGYSSTPDALEMTIEIVKNSFVVLYDKNSNGCTFEGSHETVHTSNFDNIFYIDGAIGQSLRQIASSMDG
mgnify:CR=1 FL=1